MKDSKTTSTHVEVHLKTIDMPKVVAVAEQIVVGAPNSTPESSKNLWNDIVFLSNIAKGESLKMAIIKEKNKAKMKEYLENKKELEEALNEADEANDISVAIELTGLANPYVERANLDSANGTLAQIAELEAANTALAEQNDELLTTLAEDHKEIELEITKEIKSDDMPDLVDDCPIARIASFFANQIDGIAEELYDDDEPNVLEEFADRVADKFESTFNELHKGFLDFFKIKKEDKEGQLKRLDTFHHDLFKNHVTTRASCVFKLKSNYNEMAVNLDKIKELEAELPNLPKIKAASSNKIADHQSRAQWKENTPRIK